MSGTPIIWRHQWEQPGLTVAGHTNSPPVDWSKVTNVTLHYPGGGTWPSNPSVEWFIGYMRSMQASYVRTRSYSIGYNETCTQNGIVAVARGQEFRAAANGNTATNTPSYTIQVVSNIGSVAEALAIDSINERIAWAEEQAGRQLEVLGHRDHKATACPGDEVYHQIKSDVFYGIPDTPPPPPPPPPVDADDNGLYFVQPGNSPWQVAEFAYGKGTKYPDIMAANMDDENGVMNPGELWNVPDVDGAALVVNPGEGAYSLIRRGGSTPNSATIERFYGWNGGQNRTLHPGDTVFVEAM